METKVLQFGTVGNPNGRAPGGPQLNLVVGFAASELKWPACADWIATYRAGNFNVWIMSSLPEARLTPPRAPYDLLSSGNTAVGGVPRNVRPDCTGFPRP